MRLHHLRLRAFGPFADEQRIDFDPLGLGGLFLLDGPTGAGKSTVLDAITFALYGPGERGGDGRLHSHFAQPGAAPEVCLEFSVRGARQRVTRSPEHVRPKRRGDGTTVEPARVHLERHEHGRWVSRSSNKAEVGDLLADDLGLTREQFTQVVLLPQGEFMRFLRADDDDRRGLLTKLFGTELYDRITDELERRRKAADQDVALAAIRVQRAVAAAAEAAGLDDADSDELAGHDAATCAARLDELGRRIVGSVADAETARSATSGQLAVARADATVAEAAGRAAERYLVLARQSADHERGRAASQRERAEVAAAERSEPVRPLLGALADAAAEVDATRRRLLGCAPDATEQWRAGAGADELAALAAQATDRAGELTHLVAREADLDGLRANAAGLARRLAEAGAELAAVRTRQQELPELIAGVDAALRSARDGAAALEPLRVRHAACTERHGAAVELAALAPLLTAATKAQQVAFASYADAVDEHQRRIERRLAGIAAELAQHLDAGEPCPVCGARDHPQPRAAGPDAVSADSVAAAEGLRRAAEAERERCTNELAGLERRREALLARAGADADPAGLDAERALVATAITDAERRAAEQSGLTETKARLEVERERTDDARLVAEKQHTSLVAELDVAEHTATALADELAAAADGHPSVADRQQELRRGAAVAGDVADAVRAVRAALEARAAARDRADAEAVGQGFADADAAALAALPAADLVAARARVDRWAAEDVRLRGLLAECGALDHDAAAAAIEAARDAAQRLADAESDAERAAVAADRAARMRERFERARAQVTLTQREHGDLREATAPLVHLARLARGMAGHRRVALTTYVLRQWFEQVVAAANVRLAGMSSGRYELVRVDDGASKAERTGLTLRVLDRHTGEQRSTRSLSGGETFYTSLALALGLADVVRAEAGGVDLDTLFIDEGFGSLDADTLDDVMAVIDELRGHGRTVGIVSHVSELKHRIAERIEVRRLPDGSSALRVVA